MEITESDDNFYDDNEEEITVSYSLKSSNHIQQLDLIRFAIFVGSN